MNIIQIKKDLSITRSFKKLNNYVKPNCMAEQLFQFLVNSPSIKEDERDYYINSFHLMSDEIRDRLAWIFLEEAIAFKNIKRLS